MRTRSGSLLCPRTSPTPVTVALVSVATACGGGKLDRARAQDVLSRSDSVTTPVVLQVSSRSHESCESLQRTAQAGLRALLATGKARLEPSGEYCYVALTDAGKRDSADAKWVARREAQLFGPELQYWRVPVATREVRHVDGILQSDNDASSARVQYTWGMKLNPLGERVAEGNPRLKTDTARAEAQLKKFDDGWRVTAVSMPGVR